MLIRFAHKSHQWQISVTRFYGKLASYVSMAIVGSWYKLDIIICSSIIKLLASIYFVEELSSHRGGIWCSLLPAWRIKGYVSIFHINFKKNSYQDMIKQINKIVIGLSLTAAIISVNVKWVLRDF